MAKNSKTAHLRDKTDAECRELMIHYYLRARRAEDAAYAAITRAAQMEREILSLGSRVGQAKELAEEILAL